MATTKNKKGQVEKVMESAADAAVELGAAAQSLKEGWDHVQKARRKATPATRAMTKAGRKAARAVKRATKKVRPRAKKKAAKKKRR